MNNHKISLFLVSFLLMAFAIPSHGQSFSVEATADPPTICEGGSSILTAIPVSTNQSQKSVSTNHRNSGDRPIVTISFASPVSENDFTIEKADLKYNKDFAYSIQVDDGKSAIYEKAYPLLEGGEYQGEDLPGLYYTDGCGNNISFKMATAHYSWHTNFNVDMHEPSNEFVNTITWGQILEMYQNNWGIYNHSFGHTGASGDDDYDVLRNHSFTKRNTYPEVEGGIHMNLFVIPGIDTFLGPTALNNGYNQVIAQSYNAGNPYYNVNEDEYFNIEISRHFGISEIESVVDQLAEAASNGEKGMATTGLHDFNFQEFRNQLENIEEAYGKSGTDQLWFATSEEVIQYLYIRDSLELSTNTNGNTVTITLNGDLPSDFRFYALSLLIDSEADITDIQVENGFNNTTNTNFDDQALINLNWDERIIIPRGDLAEEYVSIAEETQETNDALIGMDYTEMVEDPYLKDFYRSRLCAIPGVDLPEGYCSEITDYTYEWTQDGEVIGNEFSIEVSPESTSTYEAEITAGGETASDTVTVALTEAPYIEVQDNDEVCSDQPYELSVEEAGNYSQIQWGTSGDGYFSDNTTEEPTYYPGDQDLESGTISLTVTAISEECENASDTLILDFIPLPSASAGENITACEGNSITLSGEVANSSDSYWYTLGDGTFENSSNLNTVYYPGENDIETGNTILQLIAESLSPCNDTATDDILMEFKNPSINAGPDTTLCAGTSVQLSAQGEDYDSLIWITQGDGTFENPQNAETTYYPGPEDEEEMQVLLYAEAINTVACDTTVTDSLMVTFEELPQAETDSLQAACANDSVIEISGTAEYYSEAQWSTEGSGQFSDTSSLNTNYLPSQEDLNSGEVSLILSVSSSGGCQSEDADTLILDFTPSPFASTGDNISICESDSVTLSGETANSSDSYWYTLGDGSFEDSSNLNTVYYPGENDIETGNAILQLIAEPLSPCNDTTVDNLTITIDHAVTVNIEPEEDTICAGVDFAITAYPENNSGLEWEALGGEGDIVPVNQPNTTYYSAQEDTLNSPVTLEVTAYPTGSCESNATDQLLLYFIPPPGINAGEDDAMCVDEESYQLSGEVSGTDNFTWITQGDGTFSDTTILDPLYYPGENELEEGYAYPGLKTTGSSTCSNIITDFMLLEIHEPSINAGPDTTLCAGTSVQLSAQGEDYDSLIWITQGDGTFENPQNAETTYYPGPEDEEEMQVLLYAEAINTDACDTTVSDSLMVTFEEAPQVETDSLQAACANDSVIEISGTAEYYSEAQWSTEGSGQFSDASSLNTNYLPSQEDINSGEVSLFLNVSSTGGCQSEDTDTLILDFVPVPFASAGDNISTCEGSSVTLSGEVANSSDFYWQTLGDGIFENSSNLNTIYTPGENDIETENAIIQLIAEPLSPCNDNAVDNLTITIDPAVTVNIEPEEDTIYAGDEYELTAYAENNSALEWEVIGGEGDIEPVDQSTTTYYSVEQDTLNSPVTLEVTAYPAGSCESNATDQLLLYVIPPPEINAGEDIETCVTTDEVMVNGSSELNTSFTWTTSGEGEFENPNELQTTYFPHENDITNGEVTLTLSEDNNPEILNDSLTVFFHDLPTCELEEDTAGICGDDSLFLAPEISNATTVEWNTSGDGTFSDTTSVETTYFPGNNDIDNGSVILYATAYSDYCPDTTASDSIIVNIEPAPIANAGADSTVCSNINMVLLSDAEAFDYDSVNWSSSGTGNFNDETLVNAQYYPSAEDKSSGQVTLTLTALGQEYCSDEDDDSRTFFFSETPSVTIPGEYSACESSFVEVEALASDAASIEWYTEGDGTFTDSLGVTAVYQAGDEDITNGEAMLYAVASGMAECSNVTDTAFTLLGVFSEPTVDAGNDTVTCNDSHLLNGEATDFSEIQWSTSGTGYFENPNLLQTFYYPSEQDFEEGQVTLTLAADPISPCTEETSDTLVLTLQSTPPPPSQPQGEQTVCYEANTQTQTQYSTDPVEEANQYIWTISPPARGEFAQSITNEPQNTVTWGEATGSFTINVKAENNCGTSDYSEGLDGNYLQADVEIEASPDSIACFSQNIELNAISSEGSYIWYPGGFTGQTIIVDTSMFDGNEETYEVEFTDINGCTATDNINVMFTPCTSAPSPQQEKQPVITPNPARKYIKIKYHKKARMELLNSNGQNLKTFHHHFSNNSEKKISLSNLPTGIYIIKIQNTKTTYIHKFVHIR